MIVVDACVWVDLLMGRLASPLHARITDDLCVSPPHVDFEVGSALVRAERRGALPTGAAARLVELFTTIPCRREYDPGDAATALRYLDNATYADAWYLATADRLSCAIASTDSAVVAVAEAHGLEVVTTR